MATNKTNPRRVRINCYQNKAWLEEVHGFRHNSVVETLDVPINTPDANGFEVWITSKNVATHLSSNDYTLIN